MLQQKYVFLLVKSIYLLLLLLITPTTQHNRIDRMITTTKRSRIREPPTKYDNWTSPKDKQPQLFPFTLVGKVSVQRPPVVTLLVVLLSTTALLHWWTEEFTGVVEAFVHDSDQKLTSLEKRQVHSKAVMLNCMFLRNCRRTIIFQGR